MPTSCVKLASWRLKKAARSAGCWRRNSRTSCGNAKDTTALEGVPGRGSAKDLTSSASLLALVTSFMSDKFFVDTNIFLYAHDRTTGNKHERARALIDGLWMSGNGVLSTQVLQELCINLRRKTANPLSIPETRRLLQDYLSWEVVVNTAESVIEALAIELRYNLSFWDSLIIQAAASSGARVLYSEDLKDGQSYGPVRVLNPLKTIAPK